MILDASFAEAPRSVVTPQTIKQDQASRQYLKDANGVVTTVVNPGNGVKQIAAKLGAKVAKSQMRNQSSAKPPPKTVETSREARREVMREEGIPTSQQPTSQSRNQSGREFTYEVPTPNTTTGAVPKTQKK